MSEPDSNENPDEFPETRDSILLAAANGDWTRFSAAYLLPCWREVVVSCRTRGLQIPDADELFQEMMLRLMRDGIRDSHDSAETARENAVRRHLNYRQTSDNRAMFRTYLKGIVRNLLREKLRKLNQNKKRFADLDNDQLEHLVDDSISHSADKVWLASRLEIAVRNFKEECGTAKTKASRRMFDVLHRNVVQIQTASQIAEDYGVHRTNISHMLTRAYARLAIYLCKATGINDPQELKQQIAEIPEALAEALRAANLSE